MKSFPATAEVFVQAPCEALRPFVRRLVVVEFPFEQKLKLLPDTSFIAVFRFRGDHAFDGRTDLPRAAISSVMFGRCSTWTRAISSPD